MKQQKLFMAVILAGFILPNLALAAWWNPFTWNIFSWFHQGAKIVTVSPATQKNNLETYTHSTGAFSFSYPSNLFVSEDKSGFVGIYQSKDLVLPVIRIYISADPDQVFSMYKTNYNMTVKTDDNILSGYTVSSLVCASSTVNCAAINQQIGSLYLVPTKVSSIYLAFSLLPNTAGISEESLKSIIKTLSFNSEKMQGLLNQVLVSQNSARDKGTDAAIKAGMNSMRAQAALYYDAHNAYSDSISLTTGGICTAVDGLQKMLANIKSLIGSVTCYSSKTVYAVSAPLKLDPNTNFCVDSTGYAGSAASPTAASKGACK